MTTALKISERDLQEAVLEMARAFGWRCYHTFDSRRSEPGFPDIIAVRGGRTLAVELKSDTGRLTPAQSEWLRELDGSNVAALIWRPSHWVARGQTTSAIEDVLR